MKNTFDTVDEFQSTDLAATHRSVSGQHPVVPSAVTDADVAALQENGYVIIENLLDRQQCEEIKKQCQPLLAHRGRNSLEGFRTQRVYSVMARTDATTPLVEHPRVLCLLDRLLLANYLLSMYQIINILPGEKAQLLHHDDIFYRIPRPRPAVSIASIWAIDDFTSENGATVVLPGSHRWDDRRPTDADQRVSAVMPAGSLLLTLGTTWHGGGANRSEGARLAVTAQYCEPWARTQENMFLAVPKDVVRRASPMLQSLLGYSIHAPFMGNVGGVSPLRCLD
jgi:ectoine hydroxylase-related dioxygenase (phytanoyl-CoA dioxygenase family)